MSESITPPNSSTSVPCALCNTTVPVHASYIVRIEVFADPSLPPMSGAELSSFDFQQALSQIADEAAGLSADDLQDAVHRQFEYRVCQRCQRRFLANPLGKPRNERVGKN